jgi:hypothetical protein
MSSLESVMSIFPTIIYNQQKLEIAIQIAEGLKSLHTDSKQDKFKINHNDI